MIFSENSKKKNTFLSPFQNEYGKKLTEQKASHPDAVRGGSRVFHLLDTNLCYKHRGTFLSATGLSKAGISDDQLLSFVGLQFQLL